MSESKDFKTHRGPGTEQYKCDTAVNRILHTPRRLLKGQKGQFRVPIDCWKCPAI